MGACPTSTSAFLLAPRALDGVGARPLLQARAPWLEVDGETEFTGKVRFFQRDKGCPRL